MNSNPVLLDEFEMGKNLMKNFGCSSRILADSTVKTNEKGSFQINIKQQTLKNKKNSFPICDRKDVYSVGFGRRKENPKQTKTCVWHAKTRKYE